MSGILREVREAYAYVSNYYFFGHHFLQIQRASVPYTIAPVSPLSVLHGCWGRDRVACEKSSNGSILPRASVVLLENT